MCVPRALAALIGMAVLTLSAQAATLTPASVPGGYSTNVGAPTAVTQGYDIITGTGSAGSLVQLAFTNLPAGAQTLTFSLALPAAVQGPANGWAYYNSGGVIRYSTGTPFGANAWTGGTTLASFGLYNSTAAGLSQSFTLSLDNTFSGSLFLGFVYTYGNLASQFTISAPSNAGPPPPPPAAVPLPAGAVLLLSALAWLAVQVGWRRRTGDTATA